ncbi:hypothetical protein [Siansivirga zeaxanthinifaciens]|uniref:Uncharacterized protein n=1 Tax=Siansivirga zeaxanthinifaciens CC-SAMT-1 TaxID=1454006 RepID=A0A0C5WCR6_9FLAO|nr:hypothetical protein [Siansivirga zeaxanthinifaciens]AJR04823.1 hypothetical protein AW14_06630 [Siansivirga zeaxanthinifaciens CC-SAMT-1]
MNIKYNEIEKTIEIKDGVKNYYFVMKFLMILNLLNAVLRLLNLKKTGIGFQEIIWFTLGIASLIILYLFIFKRTTTEKIPITEICKLKEKSILGRSRFSIKLLNGKKRELTELKTQAEFKELKKMFAEIGITN